MARKTHVLLQTKFLGHAIAREVTWTGHWCLDYFKQGHDSKVKRGHWIYTALWKMKAFIEIIFPT